MQSQNQKNIEQAKLAAQRIYKRINYDGGNLQSYELNSLMQETYDFLKIPFKPTTGDIKEYSKVLDANGDGAVSLADLQALAVQYLCGDGVLSGLSTSKASGGFVGSHYSSSSYQNKPASDYLNYSSSLPPKQPVTNIEPQLNFTTSYGSGSLYNEQKYATNKTPLMGSNYSGSGSYPIQGAYSQFSSSSAQGAGNLYGSSYGNVKQNQEQGQQQSRQYNVNVENIEQPRSKYTPQAQGYLTITRALFKKYSGPFNTITRDKVSQLLNETYSALGRKGYYPSEQDISVWMKLCDTNSDGQVQEAEYEYFVIRALERSGVKVNA